MKIETHLHTAECDIYAHVSARDAVRMYKDAGYDCIVVTDHYFSLFFDWFRDELCGMSHKEIIHRWLRGYFCAREEGERIGVTVLPGAEVRFDGHINDYLVYGVDEDFFLHAPLLNTLGNVSELINILPDGACVVQAHPFREAGYIDHIRLFPRGVEGVEVLNADRTDFENRMANIYAEEYGHLKTAGSDNHWASGAKRLAGLECEEAIEDVADFIKKLREGKMKIFTIER